jgi:parallel beta-helix repeat protein
MQNSVLIELKKIVLLGLVLVFLSIAMSLCVIGLLELQIGYASPYADIDVETAYNMITNGSYPDLLVLDVRTQSEYDSGHIYGAVWIPHTELDARIGELAGHENHEIIVYCKTGVRSVNASEILDSNNFTKVYNMLGGITEWQSTGYPVWIATVHNVNTSFNYDTIQAAIDAPQTLDEHTITVDAGTYYEHVVVNKTVSLIGEDSETTIVDGNMSGAIVSVNASSVLVSNFTIQNSFIGVYIEGSPNSIISGNNIKNCDHGVAVWDLGSVNTTISGNYIKTNMYGIWLTGSSNKITENTFANCGLFVLYSYENLVVDNLVNGKPLVYLEGISNYTVEDAGQVILVNCNRIRVENLAISNTTVAVTLSETNSTRIAGNNITANRDYGIYLVDSSNNTISGNNITNNLNGVRLWKSSNNIMTKNNVTNKVKSIEFTQSSNNSITENYIVNNEYSFALWNSSYNTITKNDIIGNYDDGIKLFGSSNNWIAENEIKTNYIDILLAYSSNNNSITRNNLTNSADGIWIEHSSNNNWIDSNTITANTRYGIYLLYSSNYNRITGNNITANDLHGLWLWNSSNNCITENKIANNGVARDGFGIRLWEASNNTIYHNNFIDNNHQVFTYESENVWDDGYPSGGNYWSNYNGTDANQDGIGDTAYDIDVNNQDNYPLMGMFCDFNATSEYHVQTICNSSISDFQFNGTAISFNVSGENGTTGFCRILIPTALMNGTYKVFVNYTEVQYIKLGFSNSTHSYLYFTYNHSTQEVVIIPEFPTLTTILIVFTLLTVSIAIHKRRLLKTSTH